MFDTGSEYKFSWHWNCSSNNNQLHGASKARGSGEGVSAQLLGSLYSDPGIDVQADSRMTYSWVTVHVNITSYNFLSKNV